MSKRIITPFGATTTAMEIVTSVDLRGKRAIVTGGASGIGVETARALAQAGAYVTLAVRSMEAGEAVAEEIKQTTRNPHVTVGKPDLSDLQLVHAFINAWNDPLDILVNNAGVMAIPQRQLSAQGHEMHFATNHLGHFALALGLHSALASTHHVRIVAVSSVGHIDGDVDLDDLDFEHRPYDPWLAYGQSKTANILFAVEAARRWAADGIVVNALNPGRIWDTNLGRYLDQVSVGSGQAGLASRGVSVKTSFECIAQIDQQVKSISILPGTRRASFGSLSITTGTITANQSDTGMLTQPACYRGGFTIRQDIHWTMGL